MTPTVIATLAGSDSFAGAGIQADLKTAHAQGVYCVCVITAVTAQNSQGVQAIQTISPEIIVAQLQSLVDDLQQGEGKLSAIKIGMLGDAHTTHTIADYLKANLSDTPVVLDTVIKATSGGQLLDEAGRRVLIDRLLPQATIITPNLTEAALLLNQPIAQTEADMVEQAQSLLELGAKAVILKGGHLEGQDAIDVVATEEGMEKLRSAKVSTPHTHGTGCTLSTAIAANIAKGMNLGDACAAAKEYVHQSLEAAKTWRLVEKNGPLNH